MVIEQVNAQHIVALCSETLALPIPSNVHDEVLIAALIRRAAGIMCPCSPGTLQRTVLDSLFRLSDEPERLKEDVETAIEKATIAGDLLELNQVATDDPDVKSTWLFAAPPAFVARPSGSVFLLGVSPEGSTPLPPSFAQRIRYERHYRTIEPQQSEDLAQSLRELRLLELSERNWLRFPKLESAKDFRARIERELQGQLPSGEVSELLILDSNRNPSFYKGRWVTPRNESGCFVARRPQAYGAALWGLALLQNGTLQKFLDFPLRKDRFRGSDFAWHFQMAIDATQGTPQKYRKRPLGGNVRFDFFSPIPLWAERRLAIVGRPIERERCLFSYEVPEREAKGEEIFLESHLWLESHSSDGSS